MYYYFFIYLLLFYFPFRKEQWRLKEAEKKEDPVKKKLMRNLRRIANVIIDEDEVLFAVPPGWGGRGGGVAGAARGAARGPERVHLRDFHFWCPRRGDVVPIPAGP